MPASPSPVRSTSEWLDDAYTRARVRPKQGLGPGRTKYNCTAPSATEPGVLHWFSHLFIVPHADGSSYEG